MAALAPPEREVEVQRRWAAGAYRGATLRAAAGERYTIVYEGRRGGGAGPDFRDAVLLDEAGVPLYGDVELHLRAANWHAHGHDRDQRYDGVVLHVVVARGQECDTPLARGARAPLAVLEAPTPQLPMAAPTWPCERLAERSGGAPRAALLADLGRQCVAAQAAAFAAELRAATASAERAPAGMWATHDVVLWVALAEGLGYGRDRQALREAGRALAGGASERAIMDTCAALPKLERVRLGGLLGWRERWRASGPWAVLGAALSAGTPRQGAHALLEALGVLRGVVSAGRACILASNVVLPFGAALAELREDRDLSARVTQIFAVLAAPPSNAITRLLGRQLGLRRLPTGAAAHAGLQQVWALWCRRKTCDACVCARHLPAEQ